MLQIHIYTNMENIEGYTIQYEIKDLVHTTGDCLNGF